MGPQNWRHPRDQPVDCSEATASEVADMARAAVAQFGSTWCPVATEQKTWPTMRPLRVIFVDIL